MLGFPEQEDKIVIMHRKYSSITLIEKRFPSLNVDADIKDSPTMLTSSEDGILLILNKWPRLLRLIARFLRGGYMGQGKLYKAGLFNLS